MALIIRSAQVADQAALYAIGLATKELQVSATDVFMEPAEFLRAITNEQSVFLVAQWQQNLVGFIYATLDDKEMVVQGYACLVYLAVMPAYRGQGIAQALYQACEQALKARGIHQIYSWANTESNGAIIQFFQKQGFAAGHRYMWMDKKF